MNAKLDMWTWKEIVQQCQSRSFGSINVASKVRSDAIIAADELVGLVIPELASLLERLARHAISVHFHTKGHADWANQYHRDAESADAYAARIRESLD